LAEEEGMAAAAPRAFVDRIADEWLAVAGLLSRERPRRRTPAGRREAGLIVRSHRLWEAWLGRRRPARPLDPAGNAGRLAGGGPMGFQGS
jgi:hypothetical protein